MYIIHIYYIYNVYDIYIYILYMIYIYILYMIYIYIYHDISTINRNQRNHLVLNQTDREVLRTAKRCLGQGPTDFPTLDFPR